LRIKGNIAIDGPAGAGKSTVAKLIAQRLGYVYVDTGAMYRALTWKALERGISPQDEEGLLCLLRKIDYRQEFNPDGSIRVYWGDKDITRLIRGEKVTENVSTVAQHPRVRQALVGLQREMARTDRVVMDGRDIGTNVLPDAPYKFFLTASLEERAKRRYLELLSQGEKVTLEEVKRDIARRDERDSQRPVAPLKPAADAVIVDTTHMNPEEVVDFMLEKIKERSLKARD